MPRHYSLICSLTILVMVCSNAIIAQQTIYDETTVLLKDQFMVGGHIHPHGWGLNYQRGHAKTVDRTYLWGIEVLGMKHPKEQKQFNASLQDSKSFVYGKLNAMYIARPTIGVKRILTEKLRKNGVEVSLNSHIGPSFAFTKPIYLMIVRANGQTPEEGFSLREERYDPEMHGLENIYGRANSFMGFGELNFHPGIFFKTGLFFEHSPYQRGLRAIEAGAMIDIYFDRIPIMALDRNKEAFFNFYVNVYFGRKFNKRSRE